MPAAWARVTHPPLDHPSEPRPLAGDPGVAAKDGAPTFEGDQDFKKLRVGHPPDVRSPLVAVSNLVRNSRWLHHFVSVSTKALVWPEILSKHTSSKTAGFKLTLARR